MAISNFDDTIGDIDSSNSTTTPLAVGGIFTGAWADVTEVASIGINMISNVASAANGVALEFSMDGVTVSQSHTSTYNHQPDGHLLQVPPHGKYFRVKYTNGASAQGSFAIQTITYSSALGHHTIALDDPMNGDYHVPLMRSVITGETTAGGGDFVNVKVTPSGAMATQVGEIVPTLPATGSGSLTALNTDVVFDNSAGYHWHLGWYDYASG